MHRASLLLATALVACTVRDPAPADSAAPDTAQVIAPIAPDTAPVAGVVAEDSVAMGREGAAPAETPAKTPAKAPAKAPAKGPSRSGTGAPATPSGPAQDTLRGIVAQVGSFPMTSVVVRPAGGRAVTITGPLAHEIGRAAGADAWVAGTRTADELAVTRYAIRTVDGQPATDGTLARDGNRLVLVTPAGRRPIARPLEALEGMIGARVWLVGPLDGTISSYGVLREP